jgi:hypothetical protein
MFGKKKRQEIHREAELTTKATETMKAELEQAGRRLDAVLEKLKRRADEGRPLLRVVDRP